MSSIGLKTKLHQKCVELVNIKVEQAKNELAMLKEAMDAEGKESSADEQDAGRAMIQIEQAKSNTIYEETIKLKDFLKKIDVESVSKIIQSGSLVVTNNGDFYISVSLGRVIVDEKTFLVISIHSPIGAILVGKTVGETFNFNDKNYKIEKIV
jgi:transcription elongation GreA/GreB family factor